MHHNARALSHPWPLHRVRQMARSMSQNRSGRSITWRSQMASKRFRLLGNYDPSTGRDCFVSNGGAEAVISRSGATPRFFDQVAIKWCRSRGSPRPNMACACDYAVRRIEEPSRRKKAAPEVGRPVMFVAGGRIRRTNSAHSASASIDSRQLQPRLPGFRTSRQHVAFCMPRSARLEITPSRLPLHHSRLCILINAMVRILAPNFSGEWIFLEIFNHLGGYLHPRFQGRRRQLVEAARALLTAPGPLTCIQPGRLSPSRRMLSPGSQ